MSRLTKEINKFVSRSMDRHVKLAVTGLSRAGKTAFITSLVNQCLHAASSDKLPLLSVTREGRMIGAKRIPQSNLSIPSFTYDEGMDSLLTEPPAWPEPTRDVSELRLAIKFKPKSSLLKHLQDSATLYVDIVDYPGEWLLDLPLLDMNYLAWSKQQQSNLTGHRKVLSEAWLLEAKKLDPLAPVDEKHISHIAELFTQYLHDCKDSQGLHWVQPGRFVLPGELAGAPVLQFFPFMFLHKYTEEELAKASKDSNISILKKRYKHYQQHVVKKFYNEHFRHFDRQIVLVDCLQPLNAGEQSFNDMRQAVDQLMHSFQYGKSSMLKRLFSPKIDKVLFAATKADHVTPEQHPNMVSLLQQMIHQTWQETAYEGIKMECMSIASIQATTAGMIDEDGDLFSAISGVNLEQQPLMMFPGEVPQRIPTKAYWETSPFNFMSFQPLKNESDKPLQHIRMDKAMQFLLGDKLI
ncbi:YcjX family protein [Aliivibrio sp. S3MY1]|uniref:YcjX family protein n=1 Tax=unclassified Aliivibrio TaxID=2645654 RepID=UPI002379EA84|nr:MULTISPECIES: YcjX family protein [unclassified Aliivibrio]MDD9194329.1 YcjX family protein [Aliivibrio sp. S3MY1]MDD9197997.1 YcjX family protein [Aliivibrio sp. S2MY1]